MRALHLLNRKPAVLVGAHMGKRGGAALHNRAALESGKVVVLRAASITVQAADSVSGMSSRYVL